MLAAGLGLEAPGSRRRAALAACASRAEAQCRRPAPMKARLMPADLARLVASVAADAGLPRLTRLRDVAIIPVMADLLARRSEVSGLTVGDLRANPPALFISRSKTDQEGHGHLCPVSADTARTIEDWLAAARLDTADPSTPLFLPLTRGVGWLPAAACVVRFPAPR